VLHPQALLHQLGHPHVRRVLGRDAVPHAGAEKMCRVR
jgi:hypothetical protein